VKNIDLTKTVPISLFLLNNNVLEMLCVDFSFTLITEAESDSAEDLLQARVNQNVSFAKIVTFLDSVLNETVVYSIDDANLVDKKFDQIENNFMILPDVSEMVLLSALHYKLNSIISENSLVTAITCNDKLQNLSFSYNFIDEGEGYTELPSYEEWCPELSYWNDPWWCRNDITTIDRVAASEEEYHSWLSGDKITVEQQSVEVFDSIDSQFKELFSEDADKTEAELIDVDFKKSTWKPRLVD
jgi:hypothetical protein